MHTCHAVGCLVRVSPTKLMCKAHWRMVPFEIKYRILRHYRIGQCYDGRPSREWILAARDAIRAVQQREEMVRA